MTTLRKRVEQLLEESEKTQADLARHLGITPQAVNNWMRSGAEPKGRRRQLIAEFFGVTEAELLFGSGGAASNARVPVIEWAQACRARYVVDNTQPHFSDQWFYTPVPVARHTHALMVPGDSMMNPAGWPSFPAGSTIVVEPEMAPGPGDFIICCSGGDAIFAQLERHAHKLLLKPLNPRYPMIEMADGDLIVGVVRGMGAQIK